MRLKAALKRAHPMLARDSITADFFAERLECVRFIAAFGLPYAGKRSDTAESVDEAPHSKRWRDLRSIEDIAEMSQMAHASSEQGLLAVRY